MVVGGSQPGKHCLISLAKCAWGASFHTSGHILSASRGSVDQSAFVCMRGGRSDVDQQHSKSKARHCQQEPLAILALTIFGSHTDQLSLQSKEIKNMLEMNMTMRDKSASTSWASLAQFRAMQQQDCPCALTGCRLLLHHPWLKQ